MLIDNDIKFVVIEKGILNIYSSLETSNGPPEKSIALLKINFLANDVNSIVHNIIITWDDEERTKTKISIPYPHKLNSKLWVTVVLTFYVLSRLESMKKDPGNEIVQEKGIVFHLSINVLGCKEISLYVENISSTDRIHIVRNGGLKLIIDAMNSFHDNFLLHRAAIASIQSISAKGECEFVSY